MAAPASPSTGGDDATSPPSTARSHATLKNVGAASLVGAGLGGLAGGPLGLAAAALDVAVPYAAQRVQGGKIIGEHQLVGGRLADMHVRTAASRALVLEAAERADGAGWATPGERAAACAGAILFAAEAATQTALDALQVLGGNGYINDYPTGRLLRDAKLYEIGAGTSEIRRLVVARALVGAHKGAK